MILEICAGNFQSAMNAMLGGAHRIELCKDLHLDGITPEAELIRTVLDKIDIPVFVLIRPRPGNFVYSDHEFQEMLLQVDIAKEAGCAGIVSGVLTSESTIDVVRTAVLIARSAPLPFTFHRAFDEIIDWRDGIDTLESIGVSRVLTSGPSNRAISSLDQLIKLKNRAKDNLIIMPGGGVRPEEVRVFAKAGFTELHSSAVVASNSNKTPGAVSDLKRIKLFRDEIRGITP